jgi:hypothetical protein
VKAYSIAIDVFGRAPDFDANVDPIVRIEATRLRASLDQYYEAHGSEHAIHIHLPRGNCIAEFTRAHAARLFEEADTKPDDRAEALEERESAAREVAQDSHVPNPTRLAAGFVVAVGLIMAGGYFATTATRAERPSLKPVVVLNVTARNPADETRAEKLEDALLVSLIRFGTLRRPEPPYSPQVSESISQYDRRKK